MFSKFQHVKRSLFQHDQSSVSNDPSAKDFDPTMQELLTESQKKFNKYEILEIIRYGDEPAKKNMHP